MGKIRVGVWAAIAVAVVGCSEVRAQSTSAINGGIQFDFSLPGARSLGLAGAFVAVADDVSAVQANPAGLTRLSKPEVSAEFRGWNFFSLSPDRGHAYGDPTNVGIDTISGIQNKTLKDTRTSPGMLAVAVPAGKWVLAGYRQQFSRFKNRIEEQGPFVTVDAGVDRLNPVTGSIELNIVDYGVSVGRQVTPNVSIGGGVAFYDFSLESRTQVALILPHDTILTPAQRPLFTGLGQEFGPPDFADNNVLVYQQQDGDDVAVAVNAGITWHASDRVRIGAAFRQGPVFNYGSKFFLGTGLAKLGVPSAIDMKIDDDPKILFHVPDAYAGGLMYRPTDNLNLSFEYDRVQYHELLNGDGNGLPVETAGQAGSGNPALEAEAKKRVEGLKLDNSNQVRFGAEYYVTSAKLLVRLGTWYDPDHRQRFEDMSLPREVINTPAGKDVMHFAGGLGRDFGSFRLDGAVDLSPYLNTFSIAAVFYLR